jgi:glycosyltransferase AglD
MISVFIPVYNEEAILEGSVRRVLESLKDEDAELFIVDDSSTDKTSEIGRRMESENPRIRYLRYENGPSRRENLAASFHRAKGGIIAFIDADLSAGPENLPQMICLLKDADIVVGSKYVPGSTVRRSLLRSAYSEAAAWATRLYLGSRLKDHQCGLKAFRRDVLLALVAEAGYDSKMRRGFAWDTEVLVRAQRKGLRIIELPVEWAEAKKSSVRMLRDWKMIPYVVSLKSRL